MGWASFLEDIETRLDDAMRLYSLPDHGKRGSISIESLRDTNDLLRAKNDELVKVVLTLKAEIASKKQTDFCKSECIRLKQANFKLVRLLKSIEDEDAPLDPIIRNEAPAPRQPKKIEPTSQHLREAKKRFHDATKVVEAAKKDLKQAEKVRTKAQNEYQGLLQSERNSTKYINDAGHRR
jgi:hypothetical protein